MLCHCFLFDFFCDYAVKTFPCLISDPSAFQNHCRHQSCTSASLIVVDNYASWVPEVTSSQNRKWSWVPETTSGFFYFRFLFFLIFRFFLFFRFFYLRFIILWRHFSYPSLSSAPFLFCYPPSFMTSHLYVHSFYFWNNSTLAGDRTLVL